MSRDTCSSGSDSSVPAPPWRQVWADNFNGPADASVNARDWQFDTGRGIFGTGEVETAARLTAWPASGEPWLY